MRPEGDFFCSALYREILLRFSTGSLKAAVLYICSVSREISFD